MRAGFQALRGSFHRPVPDPVSARADAVADFYRGKTITFTVVFLRVHL